MSSNAAEQAMSPTVLTFFADIIRSELGIVYDENNFFQLEGRLRQLCKLRGNASVDELLLDRSPEFREMLLEIATNNETSFFRDPLVFEALAEIVKAEAKNASSIRIWSAACSYGQEPYTIAMLLDSLVRDGLKLDFSIMASDFSKKALRHAENGRYSALQMSQGLPPGFRDRYFRPVGHDGKEWEVYEDLRKPIQFAHQNLREPFDHLGTFSIIFCRNVLIYQDVPGKQRILSRIYDRLKPGGYLLLGGGESLLGVSDLFEMTRVERSTYYRRPL